MIAREGQGRGQGYQKRAGTSEPAREAVYAAWALAVAAIAGNAASLAGNAAAPPATGICGGLGGSGHRTNHSS
jgi:hypothetical protein